MSSVRIIPDDRIPVREWLYHAEMMLAEMRNMQFPNRGDTRNYLSIDMVEHQMLCDLLSKVVVAIGDLP